MAEGDTAGRDGFEAVPARCDAAEMELSDSFSVFDHIETRPGGREERLEDVTEDFGYLAVRSEHDRYHERTVPWHWHRELEVFYMLRGSVEYATPHARATLPEGSAGLVNANVLHMTRATGGRPGAVLLVHEVRPRLLAEPGSRVFVSCVEPLTSATSVELMVALPEVASDEGDGRAAPGSGSGFAGLVSFSDARLCAMMRASFATTVAREPGWELRLRDQLGEIWLSFLGRARPRLAEGPGALEGARDERLKRMINYVGLHYPERLEVADIAAAGFTSERECHRTFREVLGQTPAQYLREYRIQQACRMLAHTTRPVAAVAGMCGLGSASHFGQVFRAAMGCTPSEYRASWQKRDSTRQQNR